MEFGDMDTLSKDESLRKIDLRSIPPGSPLPARLYDKNGRVLAPAGAVLSTQQIEVLTSGAGEVFVGSEWPQKDDGVASPLTTQPGAGADGVDQVIDELRGSKRHAYSAKLSVEIDERGDKSGARRQTVVTTRNISSGGFAFECDGFVHEGAEIIATFEHLPGKPRIAGVVKSCAHVEGRRHRIGVQFLRVLHRTAPKA